MKLPTEADPVLLALGSMPLINLPDDSVDLVLCSPPYEAKRAYGELDFKLAGDDWVQWAANGFEECLRVCRGLVAWVVDGGTRRFRYSCAPELLTGELHRRGVAMRRPVYYKRHGIPGSGGPDWLANRIETVVCAGPGSRLPWSDNTACGHPPKYKPGGDPSHQSRAGRVNKPRPQRKGNAKQVRTYAPPAKANPGNVIDCGAAGGGAMGHPLAHENEAPFPLALAEFFVRSFCPPGGIVLDPFCGSGTTGHAAILHGRRAMLADARKSQIELTTRRIGDVVTTQEDVTP